MDRWLVNQNDTQFGVDGLAELKALAQKGKLSAGDMVQPPGAANWVYATEIPELKGLFQDKGDDDDEPARGGMGPVLFGVVAMMFLGVIGLGVVVSGFFYSQLPAQDDKILGEGGLQFSEVVLTSAAALRPEPKEGGGTTAVAKDEVVDLLAKRGEFYKVRTKGGVEGWLATAEVLPVYLLGGGEVKEDLDPLYNPDRYVIVRNGSWLQLDQKNAQLTVFQFQLQNQSKYPMTDLVLRATIKDSQGNQVEQVEFAVEGVVPAWQDTQVGTLAADPKDPTSQKRLLTSFTFEEMIGADPDLQLRHSDGAEVEMKAADFVHAQIDLVEVRAIPEPKVKG